VFVFGIVTICAVVVSAIANLKKTIEGLKRAGKMFANVVLPFVTILILVSFFLAAVPKETITKWLGSSAGPFAYAVAAIVGAVSLIPGFVVYPLAGTLASMGVGYPVIAVFITTLMMVGIFTLPLEAKYFGLKTALLRNALSFIAAIIIGLAVGLLWGIV
jgi:uncharacterized membrane protein YraQ (UPF0718 family)